MLPPSDYEDIVDGLAAHDARTALTDGTEELLDGAAIRALLDAPSPVVFWRERRGFDLAGFAAAANLSAEEVRDLDEASARILLDHDRRTASVLRIALEDLIPAG